MFLDREVTEAPDFDENRRSATEAWKPKDWINVSDQHLVFPPSLHLNFGR